MKPGVSEDELPNIVFVQLESFFDPTEVEWAAFFRGPDPESEILFEEYSTDTLKFRPLAQVPPIQNLRC